MSALLALTSCSARTATAVPDLLAGMILHESPSCVPAGPDLDATVAALLNADVTQAVHAMRQPLLRAMPCLRALQAATGLRLPPT